MHFCFLWEGCGYKLVQQGQFESLWKNGTATKIDNFVKPILEGQKWRVYHFHDTSDTALVKQIHGINDNFEFATDARNLATFLFRLKNMEENSYHQIVCTIRMVAPYFDDFILRANPLQPSNIQLEWKDTNNDIPFIASQLSDGTLRFICLATLLLQPNTLMPETILIDEQALKTWLEDDYTLGDLWKNNILGGRP